nr:MAG TPA: hypothetical protein [Caudoviricetes sp.]
MYKNKTYNPTSNREIIGSPFLSSMCMLCLLSHYHRLSINLNIKKARLQTCF